jgi:FkbM family methyltransferase
MRRFGSTTDSVRNLARVFSTHPLTRHAPIKAWARFASWQVRSRLQEEIVLPWVAGRSLAVRHGMTGATQNIYVGLQEFVDMMLTVHFLRKGDLFLDVGANVGSYTVLASGVCEATTWAFEPDPGTTRFLRRNIEINHLNSLVTVFELALGSSSGEITFTLGLGPMNRVADDDDVNVQTVRQEQLDTLIGAADPVMIKMDVESYEEEVLKGAEGVLKRQCLKCLTLETVTPAVSEMLQKAGFQRAYYDPFTRRIDRQPADLLSNNSIFIRDWLFVAERLETARSIHVLGLTI